MNELFRITLLVSILASMTLLGTGCGKQIDHLDSKWTPPVAISSSVAGLSGWARLHKSQDTILGAKSSATFLVLNHENNSWSELRLPGAPDGYPWGYAAIDPQSKRILVSDGYAENEQLVMKLLIGTITETAGLRDITEKTSITDKKTLLGETGPSVKLNEPGKRYGAGLGSGILNTSEAYIPYSIHAQTYSETPVSYQGKTHFRKAFERGPFNNGVFHSTDSGRTWQKENISAFDSLAPEMCGTKGHYYYFGIRYPIKRHGLWASRKPVSGRTWDEPKMIATTFANVYGRYDVVGESETVHVCWMDRRNNKMRFNLTGPPIENNDIYYRRRKDADREWSKEVLLSEGLLYCYAPTISAEGDNVVVAWAGIQTADKQHTYLGPNDIYYVTSKDCGKVWTSPLRVTDGAKDGITAGMPQVALLKGIIHLLYTQGAHRTPKEISPGLTKLGADPWPIYYQQRPFPD